MYEVEVKAKLRYREAMVKKLESLGCKFEKELHQVDHIFTPEGTTFPTPFHVPVLRVREHNDIFIFTLKISQSGRQDSIERELEISDGKMMMEIMELIKYKEVSLVDKKRTKTKYKDMVIELDEVKDLGNLSKLKKLSQRKNLKKEKIFNKN